MANAVHCVTNNLLKNNYYYALSTASAGNPTHLPSSDTGIADSGASGFYFAPGAHVGNLNSRAPPIGVEVANDLPVRSIASATLASVPSLPAAMMQGHVMPSFSHTLVGLGPFADQIFTNKDVMCATLRGYASSRDGGKTRALVSGVSPSKLHQLVLYPRWHYPPCRYPQWPASAPIPAEASMPLTMPTKLAQSCICMVASNTWPWLPNPTSLPLTHAAWIYLALEHLLVSIMLALGSPSSKRGSMLRRWVTANHLTASPILTLRDFAPTQMKPSWVI